MTNRFDRQLPFLTQEGHNRLRGVRIAVVGVGGLGSHVVQQLAYLGVTKLALIDHDKVETTNLNRLVTASVDDIGRYKVDVLADAVARIEPGAEVVIVKADVRSLEAAEALLAADYIVGCVDDDGVRFFLAKLAAAHKKPFMDLATELGADNASYGGRICYTKPGDGCLMCYDLLDIKEVAAAYENEGDRKFRTAIYGQPLSLLQGSGPSVVALNGIIASHGVMELMLDIAGIRSAGSRLDYLGVFGTVVRPRVEPRNDCRICTRVYGRPEEAELDRLMIA